MRFRKTTYILLILLGSQCENLFLNEYSTEEITAVIEGDELIIRNPNSFDVYYFAVDQETSFIIDWIPVNSSGNQIKARQTRVFDVDVIVGYQKDRNVTVSIWDESTNYWKHLVIDQ